MMKIAFYLDNRGVPNADYSRPWEGSPGIGAASFMQVALPYFIKEYGGSDFDTWILASHTDLLPENIRNARAETLTDAARLAAKMGADYFVYRSRVREEEGILDLIDQLGLASVAIPMLLPEASYIRRLAKSKALKALACVGREQYDYLMDSPLYDKLAYIDLAVDAKSCGPETPPEKDENLVVYMGALVPQKGFQVLAHAWPLVLERTPDARLSVIGSVTVYDEKAVVGPLGIAEEGFERKHILPYLTLPDGSLHPSVTFHGRLEKEKYDILRRASVGVVNPTGQTEWCCVSAVEMAACRTPVVTGAYYALLDTVHHEKTGLLGRGIKELADNICTLIENPEKARALGQAGYERVLRQYDFSAVAPKWIDLFDGLSKGSVPKPDGPLKNLEYHFKMVRYLNRQLQKTVGAVAPWPSVQEAEEIAISVRRRMRSLAAS